MRLKKSSLISLFSVIIFFSYFLFLISYISYHPPSPKILSAEHAVQLSAFVPGPGQIPITPTPGKYTKYSLFGYTSSLADVNLEGFQVNFTTKANTDGYFEFINFVAPSNIAEFCLSSVDTENISTTVLCVAAPKTNTNRKYGPYLLPPTIRVEKGEINSGQNDKVFGKTIPGTKVILSSFTQDSVLTFNIIKPALAKESSQQNITSGVDGSYSFTVQRNQAGLVRIFSQSVFANQKTPKSNTLSLNIVSWWLNILIGILNQLAKLLSLNSLILIQIGLLLFLLWKKYVKKPRLELIVAQKRALIKKERNSLIEYKPSSL